jgi:spore germination protein YaaH
LSAIYPINGGKLQADASWLQESSKINPPFAQGLKAQAITHGHLYIPMVNNHTTGILTVLDNPALQQDAADNLVILANTTRFDAPWDGVMLDFEGIPSSYQTKLSDFYTLLASELHAANLQVYIWARGRVGDTGVDYDDAYTNDFGIIGSVADKVSVGVYGYWNPKPRSMGPSWWQKQSIEYVIAEGVPASKIMLCVGLYSKYWLNAGSKEEITRSQASSLASCPCMISSNDNGLIYEKYASGPSGYCWIHDKDTFSYELGIINQYGLAGMDLFVLGMEDVGIWILL